MILTKSSASEGVETAERSDPALRESLDEEIVHSVSRKEYEKWLFSGEGPIAKCGYDCTGKNPTAREITCVVCIDLQKAT